MVRARQMTTAAIRRISRTIRTSLSMQTASPWCSPPRIPCKTSPYTLYTISRMVSAFLMPSVLTFALFTCSRCHKIVSLPTTSELCKRSLTFACRYVNSFLRTSRLECTSAVSSSTMITDGIIDLQELGILTSCLRTCQ